MNVIPVHALLTGKIELEAPCGHDSLLFVYGYWIFFMFLTYSASFAGSGFPACPNTS